MAKARQIVKRRKAVTNIRKITRTMQLIATARYQAALNRATAAKPYTEKITELVQQLSGAAGDVEHPLLKTNEDALRSVVLAITSNRGFCGGYNTGILRLAMRKIDDLEDAEQSVDVHMCGKKGISYFRFLRRPAAATYTQFEDKPRFADVEQIADGFIRDYSAGQLNAVHVVYTHFVSAGLQRPTIIRLLPLAKPDQEEHAAETPPEGAPARERTETLTYEFSPPPQELLAELLPLSLKTRLYACFLESSLCEQAARMVAMKSATDAATDMIKLLTTKYNRARQSQITLELLDIVGGAEALK
jgi:F-type H+-transporting ATPase subunit gamma